MSTLRASASLQILLNFSVRSDHGDLASMYWLDEKNHRFTHATLGVWHDIVAGLEGSGWPEHL